MNKKIVTDYLDKTPSADIEDVMFVFPEMTLKEAAGAVQRQKFPKVLRWWLPAIGIFAWLPKERRQET